MDTLPDFPRRRLLSPRELEVATFLVRGLSNKETARQMNLSARTVEDHRINIYRKLHVRNAVEVCYLIYGGDREVRSQRLQEAPRTHHV